MKPIPFLLSAGLVAGAAMLSGQTADDTNEGLSLAGGGAGNPGVLSWYGRDNRTYFIQKTDDLTEPWTYANLIEPGQNQPVSWNFNHSVDRYFLRLKYTDRVTLDPGNEDYDQDKVGNIDELFGETDPFSAADNNGNGVPDDWEKFWFGSLFVVTETSSYSDGDAFSDVQEYAMGTDPTAMTVLSVSYVSGGGQIAAADTVTPEPLLLAVEDAAGVRIKNAPVTFSVAGGADRLARAVAGSVPVHIAPFSDSQDFKNTAVVLTDGSGVARMEHQIHALAPATAGQDLTVRGYVTESVDYHDFTIRANQDPTDILFAEPGTANSLTAILLPDTAQAGTILADLGFIDADSTGSGSFSVETFGNLFAVTRDGADWKLTAAPEADFFEDIASVYDVEVKVLDGHGGSYTEVIQVTVSDADPGDSPMLAAPTSSEPGGDYQSGLSLILSNGNDRGLIFYTLDGSDPKTEGRLYTPGVSLLLAQGFQADGYEAIRLRAVVRDNGIADSPELDETYVFKPGGNSQQVFIYAIGDVTYGNGEMTLTTVATSKPTPLVRVGWGWIVNDAFVPDLSRDSEELSVVYYDPNGYSGVDAEPGNERFLIVALGQYASYWPPERKMPVGRGWVSNPGGLNVIAYGNDMFENFTGVMLADTASPETLYAGFKDFSRGGTQRHTQAVLTTNSGYLSYNHVTMGTGNIDNPVGNFAQLSLTPDRSVASAPVYYGLNLFENDNNFITTTYVRWVYSTVASEIPFNSRGHAAVWDENFGRVRLSDGWITGAGGRSTSGGGYEPDFSKPAVQLYGGLEWVKPTPGAIYNFDVWNGSLGGTDIDLSLRNAGWVACSVNAFLGTYDRNHSLGLGWTTGPFSTVPYIDPDGFAGNPPSTNFWFRRWTWDSTYKESTSQDAMDYFTVASNEPQYLPPTYYRPVEPGWIYKEKSRTVDMAALGDADDFLIKGYDQVLYLSSFDPSFGQDSDRDGLSDALERFSYRTNPYLADSDGDLIADGIEIADGLDPLVKNDPLALGYIQDVALLGQGVSLPADSETVSPQIVQVNSGYSTGGSTRPPPQVVTGARYRKIGLNGFPLPDEKPQSEDEEDQEAEETFIDAFDLSLNHSVTDLYVPLPGSSDLALQVRRNFNGSIWDSDNGHRPGERLDRPFGAGWSSNLTAFVKRVWIYDSHWEVYVQDESGSVHRFLERTYQGATYYFAMPGSRTQQDSLLNALTRSGDTFTFRKKYGATLVFEDVPVDQGWSYADRDGAGYYSQRNYFFRAESITDRHGNTLDLAYEHLPTDANASLIPETITFAGRNGAGQVIQIDADRFRVNAITDPRGHTIHYNYTNLDGGVVDSYTSSYSVPVLSEVEFELSQTPYDAAISAYTYDLAGETDYSFYGSGSRKSHLNLKTIADANGNAYRFHYDFNRTNRISSGTSGIDGSTVWWVQNGFPRQVVRVDLPASSGSARFRQVGLTQYTNDYSVSQLGTSWDDYLAGYRATMAVDAENNAHVYRFSNPKIEVLDDTYSGDDLDPRLFYFLEMELSHFEGSSVTLTPPTLTEGTAGDPASFVGDGVAVAATGGTTLLGTETFAFDLTSGLQLASVTDFSGNVTDYLYETDFPQNANYVVPNPLLPNKNLNPYFNSTLNFGSKLPEPTRKIARAARWDGSAWQDVVEEYTYAADPDNVWYLMDSVVDGRGNKRVYDIDASGNRATEALFDAADLVTPVRRTRYTFGDADFPAVATAMIVEDLDGSEDLSTYYTLDDLGRVQIQAVDVLREGAAGHPNALLTALAYDANGNRTAMVDPNTAAGLSVVLSDPAMVEAHATYRWTYDARNRRTAKQHPATLHPVTGATVNPSASEYSVFDKRGNRVGEIDLNGHITVHQYDGLNRKVRSIRIMGGNTLSPDDAEAFRNYVPAADDLVTRFGYNRLNSVVFQEDPRGHRSFLFYDGLQRLEKTLDAAGNPTAYAYDPAANTGSGAFKRDGFQPTRTVDARGYETAVEYDPAGRPRLEFAQYEQGSPNRYRVTAYRYDAAGNATHETVYPDYTGSPDSVSFAANTPAAVQLTQTGYDALDQPTLRTRADGSKESYAYTSTGLLRSERLFHPGDDPEADAPFREQRHFHDGAGRVLASRSLPVATVAEGEISWIIQGQRHDANGNVVEQIDPRNVQYGDLGTYTVPSPPTPDHSGDLNWETRYDSRNRPVMQIEPRSEDLTRTFVALDGSETIEPLPGTRPYSLTEYDQVGNPVVSTDAFGHETVTLYDRANRPTHEFTPPVATLDPFRGEPVESIDPERESQWFAHQVKHHVHDKNGNILQTRSGLATVASAAPSQYLTPPDSVDAEGTVLRPAVATPARPGTATAVIWLRTEVTNTYDALNRLETTTDGEGITVVNEYDAAGNRTAMTDGEQQRTEFEYDGFDRNTTIRHPDASEKTFAFNALVQTGRTDEEGQTTAYAYDALNRLKTVDYAGDAAIDREYFYDPEGNILAVTEVPGDATRQTNVAYAYDAAGRLTKECLGATHQVAITSAGVTAGQLASGVAADGITHEYAHDLAGNLTEVRYGASSRVLLTEYDRLNRAQTIVEDMDDDGVYTQSTDRRTRYVYDLRGSIVRKDTADGLSITHSFDALQRTRQITGALDDYGVPRYEYRQFYDYAGNVGRIDETYPSFLSKLDDRTIRNQYDLADRLTVEQIATNGEIVETAYGYDDAHNRISKVMTKDDGINPIETLENTSYTLNNDLNQVDSYTDSVSAETVSFTYDLNGARQTKVEGSEVTNYGYDFENRLTSLADADGTYAYAYDYRTRRTIRDESAAGGDKTFVIYSDGLSIQEWKDTLLSGLNLDTTNDTKQVEYVRGSGLGGGIAGLLYTVRDLDEDGQLDDIRLNHYNARGDLVAQTDHRGEVMYQAAYEAFGESGDDALGGDSTDPRTQTEGETADRQRSNTKDRDPTGLINEGMRYRRDHLYLTRDPMGFIAGPNMYTHVMQNPYTKFDPNGLLETTISQKQAENLVDSSAVINSIVNEVIQKGFENTEIQNAEQFNQYVASELVNGFAGSDAFQNNIGMVKELQSRMDKRFDGNGEGKGYLQGKLEGSRYEGFKFSNFFTGVMSNDFMEENLSVGLNVGGEAIGSDKLDHMFAEGFLLQRKGVTEDSARMTSERNENLHHGLKASGVYSNADVESNMEGFSFYNELGQAYDSGNTEFKFDIKNYNLEGMNENKNKNRYDNTRNRKTVEENEKKDEEE